MERSPEEVRTESSWVPHESRRILLWNLLFLFVRLTALSQDNDVLIVQRPQHLALYDSFQKSLSPLQKRAFSPFVPIEITRTHAFLSDGITPCIGVEIDGVSYFVLVDEQARLSGFQDLGFTRTFRKKSVAADTVEILKSDRIALRDPQNKFQVPLRRGDRCVQYFSDAGSMYVKRLGPRPSYGWVVLAASQEGTTWKVIRAKSGLESLSRELVQRMNSKVAEANRTISQIYAMLSRDTGRKLMPPQWRVRSRGDQWMCSLEPRKTPDEYAQSIEALSSTLQTYLLGTGFNAVTVNGRIEVRKR